MSTPKRLTARAPCSGCAESPLKNSERLLSLRLGLTSALHGLLMDGGGDPRCHGGGWRSIILLRDNEENSELS